MNKIVTANDCTVLINSCDAYVDILDTFFELLHRYWPELDYPIVLSTETINYKSEYFDIINIHPDKKNRDKIYNIYVR